MMIMFDKLLDTGCEGFKTEIKAEHNKWAKGSPKTDTSKNLDMNYKATGEQNKETLNKDVTFGVLVATLEKETEKAKKLSPPDGADAKHQESGGPSCGG